MSAKSVTKSQVDYSLYLVTDSTPAILGGRALTDVVQEAILGGKRQTPRNCHILTMTGVGIVQFRDKTSETAELIRIAKQLHLITSTHGVPLLINDRVDVALAVGCEGVHLGQDDMGESCRNKRSKVSIHTSLCRHPYCETLTRPRRNHRRNSFIH